MRRFLFLFGMAALTAIPQNYASFNNQPVARVSFLHQQVAANGNPWRDPSLILYFPATAKGTNGSLLVLDDVSGTGATATLVGTPSTPMVAPPAKLSPIAPYESNGSPNSYPLSVGPTLGTGPFTVSAWVKPVCPSAGGFARILDNDYRTGFYLGTDSPATHYQFVVDGVFITGSSSGSPSGGGFTNCSQNNPWQMVTGTWDGTNMNLYVNASLVAGPVAASAPSSSTMNGPLRIAGCGLPSVQCAPTGNGWWDGSGPQGIRFWQRALPAGEILTIYNAENH